MASNVPRSPHLKKEAYSIVSTWQLQIAKARFGRPTDALSDKELNSSISLHPRCAPIIV
jgi:hypothetical protein